MADWPCDELGGKTPLEAAHKPNMDLIATRGTLGLVATIPEGMPPGSDVGTMSMMGYDPGAITPGARRLRPPAWVSRWARRRRVSHESRVAEARRRRRDW